jgi:hypothetical protein
MNAGKLLILTCIFFGISFGSQAQSDDQGIRDCVNNYLEGIMKGDTARLNKAFHPSALLMTVSQTGALDGRNVKRFVSSTPAGGIMSRGGTGGRMITFSYVGVSGLAAVELTFADFKYVDLLSLLKLGSEWKIVSRVYSKAEIGQDLVSPMGGGSAPATAGKAVAPTAKKAAAKPKSNDGWD